MGEPGRGSSRYNNEGFVILGASTLRHVIVENYWTEAFRQSSGVLFTLGVGEKGGENCRKNLEWHSSPNSFTVSFFHQVLL